MLFYSGLFVFLVYLSPFVQPLIIPEELPSILSIIYSSIPIIKKGTDSRIGLGFRLGEHADVQFLVELGPQTETKPLRNQGTGSNKRQAPTNGLTQLWAQNQKNKENSVQKEEKDEREERISDSEGGKWLAAWSQNIKKAKNQFKPQLYPETYDEPGKSEQIEGLGEIRAADVIPPEEPTADGFEKFIEKNNNKSQPSESTTTEKLKDIDDVSLN